jgi:hypothetical protein
MPAVTQSCEGEVVSLEGWKKWKVGKCVTPSGLDENFDWRS